MRDLPQEHSGGLREAANIINDHNDQRKAIVASGQALISPTEPNDDNQLHRANIFSNAIQFTTEQTNQNIKLVHPFQDYSAVPYFEGQRAIFKPTQTNSGNQIELSITQIDNSNKSIIFSNEMANINGWQSGSIANCVRISDGAPATQPTSGNPIVTTNNSEIYIATNGRNIVQVNEDIKDSIIFMNNNQDFKFYVVSAGNSITISSQLNRTTMSISNGGDWEATLDLDDIFTIQIQDNEKKDILLNGNGIENATLNTDLEYLIEYRNEVFNLIGINERGVIYLDNTIKDLNGTDLFPNTLEESGTQTLPNGLILKWGSISTTSTSSFPAKNVSINFPVEFINYCRAVMVINNSLNNNGHYHTINVSKSQFTWKMFIGAGGTNFSAGTYTTTYIAIGS